MENKMLKKERKYDPPILLCNSAELFVLFYHQRLSVKVYWDEVMESLPTVIVFCVCQVQGNSICCLKSDSLHVMLAGLGFCQCSDDDQLCDRFFPASLHPLVTVAPSTPLNTAAYLGLKLILCLALLC
ncbi:hypothetical protein CHARACLAT_004911, partial [Characodon lateralis]|nr:hypothetical protein [Characodon lateralis]